MTLTKGVDAQLRYPYDLHMRGSDYFLIEVLEYKAHSGGFDSEFKDDRYYTDFDLKPNNTYVFGLTTKIHNYQTSGYTYETKAGPHGGWLYA